jgi:hypothetical protein
MKSASRIDLPSDRLRKLPEIVALHPEIFRVSAALTSESDGLGVAGV